MADVKGAPRWVELMTTDMTKAKAFYGELFGWEFTDSGPDFGNYHMVHRAEGDILGGAMAKTDDMPPMPDAWNVYFETNDAEAACDRAKAAGGQVVVSPMPIPDPANRELIQGTMAGITDPAGAYAGLWEAGTLAGIDRGEGHGQVGWVQLNTREFDTAVAFYRDVLDADVTEADMGPDMRYALLGTSEENSAAGLYDATGDLPDDVPSHWVPFFSVGDVDAAVAKIESLGGQVMMAAQDSPYGRMATVTDDQGCVFQVTGPVIGG